VEDFWKGKELLKGEKELLKGIASKPEVRDFKKAEERTWDSASLSPEALRENM
jgi:hypothetical protein